MGLKDIKIPADASDKQTTDARSALPPREFTVTTTGTTNVLSIQDRQKPQDRASTVSYRVYFLPAAFTAAASGPAVFNTAQRLAGRKVATLVGDVKAPGLGTVLPFSDPVNFGQKGYYYCVAVNRSGVEAPPQHMVAAP